ncbi:carboxypeptidase-like regulatory domain-containing protein [Verrucomicrobia bacterium]|nr:carboxypeptidase-like regulatory domain-containing protein [Verrucomicrobiota bacterium]
MHRACPWRSVLNPLDGADAELDPDEDGFTNLQEFEQNSRPNVADIPPEISLVAPTDRATFTAPTEIPFAVDTDDNVIQVTLFAGPETVAILDTPPFAGLWNNVEPGVHELTAVAVSENGLIGVSNSVTVTVEIPAPLITTEARPTNEATAGISGLTLPNLDVQLAGLPRLMTTRSDAQGQFQFVAPLQSNQRNRLFITALSTSGQTSLPATIEITHDQEPPSLFIDFPEHNTEVTTASIVVAGRMGDLLSGFMGLDVSVNNAPANVIVGIGQNGTYERGEVPLSLGRNLITATATDALGNKVTEVISVTRLEPKGATLRTVAGDAQKAVVQSQLPNPIRVQVTTESGAPIPNKLVTFQVARSDGHLSSLDEPTQSSSTLQLLTDSEGFTSVLWSLGMDAGCANNRVRVTAKGTFGDVFFCASANPQSARQINIGSGNQQRGEVGSHTTEPLRVWVNDSCNGVSGIPVVYSVVQGGGLVNGESQTTILTGITGHALADFQLGPQEGNQLIEATFANNPGNPARFVISAVKRNIDLPTTLSGLVIDNANQPIGGARCSVEKNGEVVAEVFSDASGQFRFLNLPDGEGHLHVDGLVADTLFSQPIEQGSFPSLSYNLFLIPHSENKLPAPVLLPPLNPSNAQVYDGSRDVVLRVDGIDGLEMTVKAGSMRRVDGTKPSAESTAILSLNQVHHDDIPMPMPDGAAPPFAWTLQPAGATFDPPIQIRYPNMTGLAPGAVAYFLSFNHAIEQFEIAATGHVSSDASTIMTDPGAGLNLAGWGCNCPPYAVTGDCSGTRERTRVRTEEEEEEEEGNETGPTEPREPGPNPGDCVTPCKETGTLVEGTQTRTDTIVCVGSTLNFSAPGVTDMGGLKEKICRNEDGSVSKIDVPVASGRITYTWIIFENGLPISSGNGANTSVITQTSGNYSCQFFAQTTRDCPPPALPLIPITGRAIQVNLSMQGLPGENRSASNIPHETNPGALLFTNINDNDGAEGSDNLRTAPPLSQSDPDLEPFALSISPNPGRGTATLSIPGNTRVWADDRKSPTPTTWDLSTTTLPSQLYLEGIATGTGNLTLTYSGDDTCTDQVKVEVFEIDLLLGAENLQDISLHDDWVGVDGHRVLGFVDIRGPSTRTIDVTLSHENIPDPFDPDIEAEGSVRLVPFRRSVTTSNTGDTSRIFEIIGGQASAYTEDTVIIAKVNNKEVDRESISILDFNFHETTDGGGTIPLNPAFVNEVEHTIGGNFFGPANNPPGAPIPVSDSRFAHIGLGTSPKIASAMIEVLWARKVNGRLQDSDQDTGLVFSRLPARDRGRANPTNLRLRDTSIPQTLADDTLVTYFLGHRTSKHAFIRGIQLNNVGTINSKYKSHIDFPVVVHQVSPTTITNKVSLTQIATIMTEVNEIWSQAAIGFAVSTNVVEVTPPALIDPTISSNLGLGFGESATLAEVNKNGGGTAAIDIYFVNDIYDGSSKGAGVETLNGFTILVSQTGPFGSLRSPAVFVAGPVPASSETTRSLDTMPRSTAHELGHYLLNRAGHSPGVEVWNLMHAGGNSDRPEFKRDITETQANSARSTISITNTDG